MPPALVQLDHHIATVQDAARLEEVMRYHERTKHHFARFAPGPGQLDWANQPDPFRRFEGAPLTRLPLLAPDDEPRPPPYDSLYAPGAVASQAPVGADPYISLAV